MAIKTAAVYHGLKACTWCVLTATKKCVIDGETVAHGCTKHVNQWLKEDI